METFRRTSLTVSRGTPRHDFSFLWLRLMEITNSRLIPSDDEEKYVRKFNRWPRALFDYKRSLLRLSDLGSLLISKRLHNTKQLKCENDEEKRNTWFSLPPQISVLLRAQQTQFMRCRNNKNL